MAHPAVIGVLAAATVLVACGDRQSTAETTRAQGEAPPPFAACITCHSAEPRRRHGAGPNLAGVIGRTAGTAEGFNFSTAMRDSDIIWSRESLDRFLSGPVKLVPGTRMVTVVADKERRRGIIEYLAKD